jgi:uncharacterized SAM-binding protein YcdF (DUF218 family)
MVIKLLKKYIFVILAVLIGVGGYFYIRAVGNEYTYIRSDFGTNVDKVTDVYVFEPESERGMVDIVSWENRDKYAEIKLRSVNPGRVFIMIKGERCQTLLIFHVHKNGVITADRFFGDCTGSNAVITAILIYLVALGICFVIKFRESMKESLYKYDNILYIGLIAFDIYLIYSQVCALVNKNGINGALMTSVSAAQSIVMFTAPVVFIATILVTVSNIQLIRKEGRTWRNMLGLILGVILGIGCLLPYFIWLWMFYTDVIDTHYERGFGRFFEMFLENTVSSYVFYLECILLGTIIIAVKAAKHIPAFDKDYIIIHGCQIRKDGTLTKLLQSRADRAIEFAKLQKEATGKDIVFVPSGGKGNDEIISEGEAIKRYLLENGISEDKIIKEDDSTSTEENVKLAMDKMRDNFGSDGYKAAFATTNYHVFRTGMLADKMGLKAEGIGSRTKAYFWINAFVREFIATVVKEKKTHIKVALILLAVNIISVLMLYISEGILS